MFCKHGDENKKCQGSNTELKKILPKFQALKQVTDQGQTWPPFLWSAY